jgi:hypothetical protein
VGWSVEHVCVKTKEVGEVGVDHPAVAGDDDRFGRMMGDDSLDGVGGPAPEIDARLGVRVCLPPTLEGESVSGSVEFAFSHDVDRALVWLEFAEHMDLGKRFHDLDV